MRKFDLVLSLNKTGRTMYKNKKQEHVFFTAILQTIKSRFI